MTGTLGFFTMAQTFAKNTLKEQSHH